MKQMTPEQLKTALNNGEEIYLVDVREPDEHEAFDIGGHLVPLAEVMPRANEIPTTGDVVVYCRKGMRSQIAIQRLQDRFGYQNLINLEGGLDKWHLGTDS